MKDVDKVAVFYERFFGMHRLPGASEGWVELGSGQRGCTLALHKASVGQKSGAAMKVVFGVADVRGFKEDREKEGLKFGVVHQFNGIEFANAKDPAGNSIQISNRGLSATRREITGITGTMEAIRRLAYAIPLIITEKEMAEKIGLTEAELLAAMTAPLVEQDRLKGQLWMAYNYLMTEVPRVEARRHLQYTMDMIKEEGLKRGLVVTDEAIAERAGLRPDVLKGYLDGTLDVDFEVESLVFYAYNEDLLRHIVRRSSVKKAYPDDDEE